MSNSSMCPIVVVGAGPAGLAAALALALAGQRPTIVAPRPTAEQRARDTRTFAALGGSVDLLDRLGVLPELKPNIETISGIRLIDDRGGLVRAPEVLFAAAEAGLARFGYNIAHEPLTTALARRVDDLGIAWIEAAVTAVTPTSEGVTLATADGKTINAKLVAAADGRHSPSRAAAGIKTTAWHYPQAAVTCVFSHTRDHAQISTEFHGSNGPLTTVPMPTDADGPRSSLVWVESEARGRALADMAADDFRAALTAGLQGLLGSVTRIGPRALFPLSGLEVATMAAGRIALIGEAGHVFPPIGAQGLNLGLRDAATLADCVVDLGQDDPGGTDVISTYARLRGRDVWTRTRAVDLLNRSLLTSFVPVEVLRGLALHAVAASATLRRVAMRQGLEPVGTRPRFMQPTGAEAFP